MYTLFAFVKTGLNGLSEIVLAVVEWGTSSDGATKVIEIMGTILGKQVCAMDGSDGLAPFQFLDEAIKPNTFARCMTCDHMASLTREFVEKRGGSWIPGKNGITPVEVRPDGSTAASRPGWFLTQYMGSSIAVPEDPDLERHVRDLGWKQLTQLT